MSLRGGLLKVGSLTERLQLAMDNGARRVLLPSENKRDFIVTKQLRHGET